MLEWTRMGPNMGDGNGLETELGWSTLSQEGSKSSNLVTQRIEKLSFFTFKHKYLAIYMAKILKISSTHSYATLVQDPRIRYAKIN